MVCIIDDREDVWNYARNLICVQPYVYFKNTGDINDPKLMSRKRKSPIPFATPVAQEATDTKADTTNAASSSTSSSSASSSSSTDKKTDDTNIQMLNEETNSNSDSSASKPVETEQNKSETEENSGGDSDDPDRYLVYLEEILKKVHDEYYRIYEARLKSHQKEELGDQVDESDLPDVKRVLPLIKSRVLENVVISFSGVVPTGYDLKKQRCYLMATSLGAKINEELVLPTSPVNHLEGEEPDLSNSNPVSKPKKYEYNYDDDEETNSSSSGADFKSSNESINEDSSSQPKSSANLKQNVRPKRYTTHLVAAKYGTCKVHEALKSKPPIKVVTPEWLINCNFKWVKCDEDQFKLTKDYDYKSCVFHEEYQKYSTGNPANLLISEESKAKSVATKRNLAESKEKKSDENKPLSFSNIVSQKADADKKIWIKNESCNSLSSLESKTKKHRSNEGIFKVNIR